jgi:hypothetical protein
MELTRVETAALTRAIAEAEQKVAEALEALKPFLVALTDSERETTPRARRGFPEAGRKLAEAAARWPALAETVGYDVEAVVEDLDNAEALAPLAERVEQLARRLADTRLTWLAEAWLPSLAVYASAKVGAARDPTLRALVDPLAPVFGTRRRRKR